jgi:dTDP-4-dehydrorhamnose 3,5-epimerase
LLVAANHPGVRDVGSQPLLMIFVETKLAGVFSIDPDEFEDERGTLARTWSLREFAEHGLNPKLAECNLSFSLRKGTLRGMHYQTQPFAQAKLVRCSAGAVYDVAIDLRPDSATFRKWEAVELTAENRRMFYIPEGCAHGFQTLEHRTEVFYQMSEVYAPEYARGVRWNDPAFGIEWPLPDPFMLGRDANYALVNV